MPRFAPFRLSLLALVLLSAVTAAVGCGNSRRGGGVRGPVTDSGAVPPDDAAVTDPDGGVDDPPDSAADGAVARACDTGFIECDGECIDPTNDVDNCGACGSYCDEGAYCEDASCVDPGPTCPSPRTTCGGACVDTRSNRDHCGDCYAGCEGDDACREGYCVSTCVPSCSGASCGDDGCGGTCGSCAFDEVCTGRRCEAVTPTSLGESCTTARPITIGDSFTFTGFGPDHAAMSCFSSSGNVDVVFEYTATRSGDVTVTTGSSAGSDTVLAVFDTSACGSSDEIACNDDDPAGGLGSSVTFYASSGARYYFVVTAYSDPAPTDVINIDVDNTPAP